MTRLSRRPSARSLLPKMLLVSVLATLVAVAVAIRAPPQQWIDLVRPDEGFQISFPGAPTLLTGDVVMDDEKLWTKAWSWAPDAQTRYALTLTHFPEARTRTWDPQRILHDHALAVLEEGSTLRRQHPVFLSDGPEGKGEDPGLDVVADRHDGGVINGRIYVVGSFVIEIVRSAPKSPLAAAEWTKFVESFSILDDEDADEDADPPARPVTWGPIGNAREGFLGLFPGEPTLTEDDINTAFHAAHVKSWSIDLENAGYAVKVITFPPEAEQAWKPAELLKEWQHGFVDKEERLLTEQVVTLSDPAHSGKSYPGRDCLVGVKNDEVSHLRLYLVGARLFEISRTGPRTETSEAEWRKFVEAFQVPPPSSAPPLSWSTLVGREDRFRVAFPGQPSVNEDTQETSLGSARVKVWELVANEGRYGLMVARLSRETAAAIDPLQLLKDWQGGMLKDRARVEHEEEVSLRDRLDPSVRHPGRDVSADVKDGTFLHLRLWFVGARMFQLSRLGPPTAETDAEWTRFADSFVLLGREQPPGKWAELVRADKAFQISFPGEATEKQGSDDEEDDSPSASWSCDLDDGTEYLVAVFEASTDEADVKDPGKYLQERAASSVSDLGKLRSGEEIWMQGPARSGTRYRGREFVADLNDGSVALGRFYVVDTQLFLILRVGAENPAGMKDWKKFVGSFRVLPRPGLPSDVHPPQGI